MEGLGALLPLIIIVVLFYFLLLRPARNQQNRVKRVQASLAPGARIVTTAGLHATVLEVGDGQVVLQAEPSGTRLTFERQAVVRIVDEAPAVTDGTTGTSASTPETTAAPYGDEPPPPRDPA